MKSFTRILLAALLVSQVAAVHGADEAKGAGQEAAVLYQNVCAACHGPKGEGRQDLKAPSIAALPDWYVRAQLENFRNDRRGTHSQDPEGQLMRAVSKVLTADQAKAMAVHVASLPRHTPVATIQADTTEGRLLYGERCMECHRYNAEGELFFGSPPLIGLQDWYLASQIKKYQTGIRGVHPKDVNGQKMVFSSSFVESEEVLHSLVAYLLELQKPKVTEVNPTGGDPFSSAVQRK
ncbi:c-type cytochrome [Roseimicrobium sp. ORNL1]|uniref:c-type cytochrome n=1 Tax=Roseimicrobium sp. ORNL1 TaxID=2711231 RepID=UPI0013E1DEAC|nr:c-type cytochrome [Roseimicrobium sp. ORNL1]QIF05211.1 c-type cytochrome [Roseimicrobium sp. ORNL1]